MKTCNLCGATKPLEAYHVRKDSRDGRFHQCRECQNKRRAASYQANRERDIARAKARSKTRRAVNPSARIAHTRRAALQRALRDRTEEAGVVADLGCSVAALRAHLESQFEPGMTWHNRGASKGCWSVDHTIPLASFDLTDPAQRAQALHWTNLRPMWHDANVRKGARVPVPADNNTEET